MNAQYSILNTRRKGFTLLELLVVVAIIALLSAIALVSIDYVKARARDTKRKANINELHKALQIYHTTHEKYPIPVPSNVNAEICINGVDDALTKILNQSNITLTPLADPLWPNVLPEAAQEGTGHCYGYKSNSATYTLSYYYELSALGTPGTNDEGPQ